MKKIFKILGIIVLVAVIGFTMIACDNGSPGGDNPGGENPGGENPGGDPTAETPLSPELFRNITAMQLVSEMKIGWNLGNTLDANGLHWLPANPTVAQMEEGWSAPVTTKAMIDTVKNAGFNVIRIPVSWSKATGPAPNYTIRADWMARVVEVVNYAVANDMYILLNTHHDEFHPTGLHGNTKDYGLFYFDNANKTASLAAFGKIWEQIADTFKNYNEKLIFEGLNEPRILGGPNEWNGGTAEEHAVINEYYQVFVNTVRASGGNNDKRILMFNTHAASGTATAMNALTIPASEVTANRAIVSYHNYAPNDFALSNDITKNTWSASNSGDTNPITDPIDRFYTKFASQGIPVIIGEFGAQNKNNTSTRAEWAGYYVTKAREKGLVCVWWDMPGIAPVTPDNDAFGILNRSADTWAFPEIVTAMMNAVNNTTPPEPPEPPDPTEGTLAVWTSTATNVDALGSTMSITTGTEGSFTSYTITGTIVAKPDTGDPYAQAAFSANPATLTKLREMTSISFMTTGDDNQYELLIPTTESNATYNHYRKTFTATSTPTRITVNIPSDLAQADWGGAGVVTFTKGNIQEIQFQVSGLDKTYSLKVWDIRTHP